MLSHRYLQEKTFIIIKSENMLQRHSREDMEAEVVTMLRIPEQVFDHVNVLCSNKLNSHECDIGGSKRDNSHGSQLFSFAMSQCHHFGRTRP